MLPVLHQTKFDPSTYEIVSLDSPENIKRLKETLETVDTIAVNCFTDNLIPALLNPLAMTVASDTLAFYLPFNTKDKNKNVNMFELIEILNNYKRTVVVQNLQFMTACFAKLSIKFNELVDIAKIHRDRADDIKGDLNSLSSYHLGFELKELGPNITPERLTQTDGQEIIDYSVYRAIAAYQIYQKIKPLDGLSLKSKLETKLAKGLNTFCAKGISFDPTIRMELMKTATSMEAKNLKLLGKPENDVSYLACSMGSIHDIRVPTTQTMYLRAHSPITKLVKPTYGKLIKAEKDSQALFCINVDNLLLMAYLHAFNHPDFDIYGSMSYEYPTYNFLKSVLPKESFALVTPENHLKVLEILFFNTGAYTMGKQLLEVLGETPKSTYSILNALATPEFLEIKNEIREAIRQDGYYEYLGSRIKSVQSTGKGKKAADALRVAVNSALRWQVAVSVNMVWLSLMYNVLNCGLNLRWFNRSWLVFEIDKPWDKSLEDQTADELLVGIFKQHRMPLDFDVACYFTKDLYEAMQLHDQQLNIAWKK